jgi:hypothetical protein
MSKISLKHSGGNVVSLNAPTNAPGSPDVAFKLPNADGSAGQFMKTDGSGNLSFDAVAAGGITMIDTYALSSSQVMSGATWNYVKTNFSRVNGVYGTMNVTGLGTGLSTTTNTAATNFSFPSTGYYEITFTSCTYVSSSSSSDYLYAAIFVARDGSSFDNVIQSVNAIRGNANTIYETQVTKAIIDVTNTTNDKFYLAVQPEVASVLLGSNDKFYTYLQVKKLADT